MSLHGLSLRSESITVQALLGTQWKVSSALTYRMPPVEDAELVAACANMPGRKSLSEGLIVLNRLACGYVRWALPKLLTGIERKTQPTVGGTVP